MSRSQGDIRDKDEKSSGELHSEDVRRKMSSVVKFEVEVEDESRKDNVKKNC